MSDVLIPPVALCYEVLRAVPSPLDFVFNYQSRSVVILA